MRPATIHQVITEAVKAVNIVLSIPPNLPIAILEVVDIGQVLPATMPLVIYEYMLIEVYLGHNRPATLLLVIQGKMVDAEGIGGF